MNLIYKYYDYGKKPIPYCGVTIDSTPFNLYDEDKDEDDGGGEGNNEDKSKEE